jgi:hypothetical protein
MKVCIEGVGLAFQEHHQVHPKTVVLLARLLDLGFAARHRREFDLDRVTRPVGEGQPHIGPSRKHARPPGVLRIDGTIREAEPVLGEIGEDGRAAFDPVLERVHAETLQGGASQLQLDTRGGCGEVAPAARLEQRLLFMVIMRLVEFFVDPQ